MATKINSPKDLLALRQKALSGMHLRSGSKKVQVTVHMGTCGIASGARDVLLALAEELAAAGMHDVMLRQSGCAGLCSQEPMITVVDEDGREFRYGRLNKSTARAVVQEHLLNGNVVTECLIQK